MSVNIPSAKLKELVKLAERKEALMAQIQDIDRQMLRLERQFGQTSTNAPRKGRLTFSISKKRGRSTRRIARAKKEFDRSWRKG